MICLLLLAGEPSKEKPLKRGRMGDKGAVASAVLGAMVVVWLEVITSVGCERAKSSLEMALATCGSGIGESLGAVEICLEQRQDQA